jgi:hypothetical protein
VRIIASCIPFRTSSPERIVCSCIVLTIIKRNL